LAPTVPSSHRYSICDKFSRVGYSRVVSCVCNQDSFDLSTAAVRKCAHKCKPQTLLHHQSSPPSSKWGQTFGPKSNIDCLIRLFHRVAKGRSGGTKSRNHYAELHFPSLVCKSWPPPKMFSEFSLRFALRRLNLHAILGPTSCNRGIGGHFFVFVSCR
jgi:hypothetical protein